MTEIYLLDFSGADGEDISPSALPAYIAETKNKELRRERIFSHILFKQVFYEKLGYVPEKSEKDSYGRPYIKDCPIDYNISHSDSLAAIIISDEGRVGIDVEKISDINTDRLQKWQDKVFDEKNYVTRVHTKANFSLISAVFRYENFKVRKICGKEIEVCECEMRDVNKKDFFSKWTLMEALAKADGRGLSFIEETLSDKKIKNLANMLLKDGFGNVYSLSAALKENTD